MDPAWARGFFCPGSLLSFLHYKPQITHCLLGENPTDPQGRTVGAWTVGPQVLLQVSPSAPCTSPFPACVSSSADEALSIFQDPSPPSGPSSKAAAPGSPGHGGNSQGRAHTSQAFLGLSTSAPLTLSSRPSHARLSWSHTGPRILHLPTVLATPRAPSSGQRPSSTHLCHPPKAEQKACLQNRCSDRRTRARHHTSDCRNHL